MDMFVYDKPWVGYGFSGLVEKSRGFFALKTAIVQSLATGVFGQSCLIYYSGLINNMNQGIYVAFSASLASPEVFS